MKKNAIVLIAALLLSPAGYIFAQQTHEERVSCELAAKNCLNRIEIMQKKIKKLNDQIKKGSKTYSAEELKKLEQKLQETKDLLDKLEGAGK
jgi:uncharacterized protein HemX